MHLNRSVKETKKKTIEENGGLTGISINMQLGYMACCDNFLRSKFSISMSASFYALFVEA